MAADDEGYRLRLAGAADADAAPDDKPAVPGAARFVGNTLDGGNGKYPTPTNIGAGDGTPNVFFYVVPQRLGGAEVEGGAVALSGVNSWLCGNIGSEWPPAGSRVEVTYVPHRWVFEYNGV